MLEGLKVYLKHTNLSYFSVSQIFEIRISPKVYFKYTSYLECKSIFEVQFDFSRKNTNQSLHNL